MVKDLNSTLPLRKNLLQAGVGRICARQEVILFMSDPKQSIIKIKTKIFLLISFTFFLDLVDCNHKSPFYQNFDVTHRLKVKQVYINNETSNRESHFQAYSSFGIHYKRLTDLNPLHVGVSEVQNFLQYSTNVHHINFYVTKLDIK